MKKILLSAAIALSALSAFAELGDDGYYRVQNAVTKRYAYLLDDKGKFDPATTSADVLALDLFSDFKLSSSDPSTVFYINKVNVAGSNRSYNIAGQGTSLYKFLSEYMKIQPGKKINDQQAYYAYASKSGFTKYLGDLELDLSEKRGYPSVDAKGDNRLWYIHPVDASKDDAYFGIAPSQTAGGKYYYPLYAGFPFSAYSEGVKFYIVYEVNPYAGVVALKEAKGVIPAGTPVIVECSHPLPSDNRLDIGSNGAAANVGGNLLKGVYFDNPMNTHYNRKAYDKKTMRVLTVKDGKLTFGVGNYDFLPRNQAYLQLTNADQYNISNYEILFEDDYEDKWGAVEAIAVDANVDVYSLDGRLVKSGIPRNEVYTLGKGMYILRSGNATEKLLVP